MSQSTTPSATITCTFILRFWHEQAGAESRWRGRIEHVQSGQHCDFLCPDQMLGFLREMGITLAQQTTGPTR